jgi:putative oxidoreductase
MSALTNLGKYLFAIPFLVFGLFHFMGASNMAGMVPIPGGAFWVYLTGAAMAAFAVSVFMGKYDKLAGVLLAALLMLYILLIHGKSAAGGDQMATISALKDLALAGGALMYANTLAKDNSIIG